MLAVKSSYRHLTFFSGFESGNGTKNEKKKWNIQNRPWKLRYETSAATVKWLRWGTIILAKAHNLAVTTKRWPKKHRWMTNGQPLSSERTAFKKIDSINSKSEVYSANQSFEEPKALTQVLSFLPTAIMHRPFDGTTIRGFFLRSRLIAAWVARMVEM